MALARIISSSIQCSRELALDLLARGYAVEIVSPDAVPDNIADLELRVDSGPGDMLTANVEAHNGSHSASLKFVHHLKAPMGDFIRRRPEPSEPVSFPKAPLTLEAGQSTAHNVAAQVAAVAKPPAEDSARAPEPARPMPPSPLAPAPLIVMPAPLQIALKTPEEQLKPAVTVTVQESKPEWKTKPTRTRIQRTGGWFGRAAVTFAGVVLVAVVLGFGMHRGSVPSASNFTVSDSKALGSGATGGETAGLAGPLATAEPAFSGSAAPEHLTVPAVVPAARAVRAVVPGVRKGEGKPAQPEKKSAGPKAEATASKRHHQTSRSHTDDLIAPNTIVYYDRAGTQPVLATKAPQHGAPSLKQGGGVIAASKVPDLRTKPAPKAGPQK